MTTKIHQIPNPTTGYIHKHCHQSSPTYHSLICWRIYQCGPQIHTKIPITHIVSYKNIVTIIAFNYLPQLILFQNNNKTFLLLAFLWIVAPIKTSHKNDIIYITLDIKYNRRTYANEIYT